MLGTESLNELDVLGLSASLVENAKVSLTLVKGLGALAETTSETISDHGALENLLESFLNRHLALGGIDFDGGSLVLDLVGGVVLASVITHGLRR